jgi:amidophosphoribosyltransferase
LIAATKSVEEIQKFIGADSLGYLSLNAVLQAVGESKRYCSACFTDRYPTDVVADPAVYEKQRSLFGRDDAKIE